MKYISYLTLLSLVIIVSCGPKEKSIEDIVENGSKAELNQKREELNTSMRKLNSQIKTLDKKLADFEDTSKYALVEALSLVPKDFNHYVTVQGDVDYRSKYHDLPSVFRCIKRYLRQRG